MEDLLKRLKSCSRCVILTGAGVSSESGVATFRGKEGLWGKFRPEELATMDAFMANSSIVWEWYNWRREVLNKVEPNPGHYAMCEMEKLFDHFCLITQNVDSLHQAAGSTNVLELHGNILRNKCADCFTPFLDEGDIDPDSIPSCSKCGGKIRPDVVWFGEMLDEKIINKAFEESERADLFFSIGTSAVVHPAASLPIVAKRHGALLVEINMEPTPITEMADFCFKIPSGEFLPELVSSLKAEQSA